MGYWREFGENKRPMAAAMVGLASGLALINFMTGIFGPHLIQAFGWSKATFALYGTVALLALVCIPVAGRLTDLFGVRRVAMVGVIVFPLTCVALSLMTGDIRLFFGICIVQTVLCTTTTSTVYTRLVAERFVVARGLALAVVACAPAIVGAFAGPLLTGFIADHGWRAAYLLVAAYSALFGALALILVPPHSGRTADGKPRRKSGKSAYAQVFRSHYFWIILIATLLCSMFHAVTTSQLMIVLMDQGLTTKAAGAMVSVFAAGIILGRFLSGLALDRYPSHIVAAIGMGLPSVGLLLLASPVDTGMVVGIAILLIGLAMGAEGDIVAYLVVRYFGIDVYSSVLGLMTAAMGTATALGAIILSATLSRTDHFSLFLMLSGVLTFVGAALFLLLHRAPDHVPVLAQAAD